MPCHHNLDEYLDECVQAASISGDPKSFLFRTSPRSAVTPSAPPASPNTRATAESSKSARTTGLYDRRNDQVSLDEVERILI